MNLKFCNSCDTLLTNLTAELENFVLDHLCRENCTFNHKFGRCAAIDSITIKQYVAHNQHIWRTWDSCKLPREAMGQNFAYKSCIIYELSNYQLSLKKAKYWTICSRTSKPHYIIEGIQRLLHLSSSPSPQKLKTQYTVAEKAVGDCKAHHDNHIYPFVFTCQSRCRQYILS
jgi:hypothetical protein